MEQVGRRFFSLSCLYKSQEWAVRGAEISVEVQGCLAYPCTPSHRGRVPIKNLARRWQAAARFPSLWIRWHSAWAKPGEIKGQL